MLRSNQPALERRESDANTCLKCCTTNATVKVSPLRAALQCRKRSTKKVETLHSIFMPELSPLTTALQCGESNAKKSMLPNKRYARINLWWGKLYRRCWMLHNKCYPRIKPLIDCTPFLGTKHLAFMYSQCTSTKFKRYKLDFQRHWGWDMAIIASRWTHYRLRVWKSPFFVGDGRAPFATPLEYCLGSQEFRKSGNLVPICVWCFSVLGRDTLKKTVQNTILDSSPNPQPGPRPCPHQQDMSWKFPIFCFFFKFFG